MDREANKTSTVLLFDKHEPVIVAASPKEGTDQVVVNEYVNIDMLPEDAQKYIRNWLRTFFMQRNLGRV